MDESAAEAVTLYTIGHSNLSIERFLDAMTSFGLAALVDVRSMPFSRFNPQFNRESLSLTLEEAGIEYRFAGKQLGGRPEDPTCYKNGVLPEPGADYLQLVDYPAVAERQWFQTGIERLLSIAKSKATVIMCSEEDPKQCHRHHLITKALEGRVRVIDIRTKGVENPVAIESVIEREPTQLSFI